MMPVKTLQKRAQDKRTNTQSERERKAEVGSGKKKNGGVLEVGQETCKGEEK